MEVEVRWNQSPWIPIYGEMTEVSSKKGAYVTVFEYHRPSKQKSRMSVLTHGLMAQRTQNNSKISYFVFRILSFRFQK